jgi:predicted transposase YdaD
MSYVAQDQEMLRAYQMREMALSDFTSGINHARREGIALGEQRGIAIGERQGEQRGIAIGERQGEQRGIAIGERQGIAKGERQGIAKIVVNLRGAGLPVEEIAKYTQLPAEKVAEILKEQESA